MVLIRKFVRIKLTNRLRVVNFAFLHRCIYEYKGLQRKWLVAYLMHRAFSEYKNIVSVASKLLF